jgi:hypothetical protein
LELFEYYGFSKTYINKVGEAVYEKPLSRDPLKRPEGQSFFDAGRISYPRFYTGPEVDAYIVPIKELYHEDLFPELADRQQTDLFGFGGPRIPGNTIRKVYLCRAPTLLRQPGAILFFYKGKSKNAPSQAVTTVGLFENVAMARSTEELRKLAEGRSVYSDGQLSAFAASEGRPVKVINFLLINHLNPYFTLNELQDFEIFDQQPPQSIFKLARSQLLILLTRLDDIPV